jgi:hypothetical protein
VSTRRRGALILLALAVAAGATVTVQYNDVLFTHGLSYHGVNYVGFWDDVQGSAGSREALRRGGVEVIRFPGGAPGDWYDWANPYEYSLTSPQQLYNYATAVGAKVLFQTNWDGNGPTNTSGAHVAAWVQDCINKGMDVPFWEVGNEPEFSGRTPTEYFNKFVEQYNAMKAANPNITVMGPGSGQYMLVNGLVDETNDMADALSFHWYHRPGGYGAWEDVRDAAQRWNFVPFIRSFTQKPFWVTEWSAIGPTMEHAGTNFSKTVGLAIANADIIGKFTYSGVGGHCMFGAIHNVQDNWGILGGQWDWRATDSPAPCYFVMPLWAAMGNIALERTNTSNDSSEVSAWATKESDGSVQVMLINKTYGARSETVTFSGCDPTGVQVQIHELRSASANYHAQDVYYNGQHNPQPATSDLAAPETATCSGSSFTRNLPALSITVLDFSSPTITAEGMDQKPAMPRASIDVRRTSEGLRVSLPGRATPGEHVVVEILDLAGRRVSISQPERGADGFLATESTLSRAGTYLIGVRVSGETLTQRVVAWW